jgi:hypothetical protein
MKKELTTIEEIFEEAYRATARWKAKEYKKKNIGRRCKKCGRFKSKRQYRYCDSCLYLTCKDCHRQVFRVYSKANRCAKCWNRVKQEYLAKGETWEEVFGNGDPTDPSPEPNDDFEINNIGYDMAVKRMQDLRKNKDRQNK